MLMLLRTLDVIQASSRSQPLDAKMIKVAFERTSPGAKLRRLLVEYMVMHLYSVDADTLSATRQPTKEQLAKLEVLDGTGFFPDLVAKKALLDESKEWPFTWAYNLDGEGDGPH
ncbi:hypothetical protein TI39_contig348g00010 [Zymoseptoria brevis]|uniref:Uncharacterized protein n=1 Tax=Zymoseptoria brevis TaxID=1047168 RepID=A0A0F4GR25_9PEZI|nr:hypothetical protein TI39_contig348g00010 [Zymoseptoria brevis]